MIEDYDYSISIFLNPETEWESEKSSMSYLFGA